MPVRCYLRDDQPDKQGRTMIQFAITWSGNRLRLSSGQKAQPAEWDEGRSEVRPSRPHAQSRNQIIRQLRSALDRYFDSPGISPTKEEGEAYLKALIAARDAGRLTDFIADHRPFIDSPKPIATPVSEPGIRELVNEFSQQHQAILGRSTLMGYHCAVDHLLSFDPTVTLADLSVAFVSSFFAYLSEEVGIQNNTIAANASRLHALCRFAENKGVRVNRQYHDWPRISQGTDKTWHPESEVERIVNHHYSDLLLQDVALCYAFACYTGLRVSDLRTFRADRHIRQGGLTGEPFQYIAMSHQVKTKHPVLVALSPYALDILDRIGSSPWPQDKGRSMDVFKYIRTIKKVGQAVQIDQPVDCVRFFGTRREVEVLPKFQLMASHTARHSYACNSLLRGMDIVTLQKVLGHRNIQSTMAYARITEEFQHRTTLSVWSR